MSNPTYSGRARQAALAAVEVLGEKGAAGLTHRAVDQHAGLPEGTTSNHFRTRDALIDAICRFLTDYDLEKFDRTPMGSANPGKLTVAAAADAIVAVIEDWTIEEAVFTAARLELFLIAHRSPEVASKLQEVRRTFRARTVDWLESLSKGAGRHAALVMATVEGLTANQLLHAEGRISRDQMKKELRLLLTSLVSKRPT